MLTVKIIGKKRRKGKKNRSAQKIRFFVNMVQLQPFLKEKSLSWRGLPKDETESTKTIRINITHFANFYVIAAHSRNKRVTLRERRNAFRRKRREQSPVYQRRGRQKKATASFFQRIAKRSTSKASRQNKMSKWLDRPLSPNAII
ncbi:MAG: hypothetical protein LKG11_06320 [Bacilli bacterium]|jgi:hypothetical protein|nr:hypothetical protein [Bacilli bacterium]